MIIRNYNIRIWTNHKDIVEILEDPFVVLNCKPDERVTISFGDNELWVSTEDWTISIDKITVI